ncbi:DUF2087 domain-containing protein [Microvirga thermotolerans]|uniref:DUF2087 domain-containing protein n=1 Tax=Microvirga thermotolerans TaxID=2651334 RepID=A0A5P9JWJ1_9HYPH|nr:DUF2087 domain-containing protein [Microvirga thermotolerans]QFU16589.1 DUF2087 domain-containing protein [Microvirga thermotolerans]
MSRTALPFHSRDISALARSLRQQLAAHKALPGHVEMLNMLARSVGHRNFQQLRAQAEAHARLSEPPPAEEPVDFRRLERLARCYDSEGRLRRWPARNGERLVALWVLWSRLPARETMSEREVNERLQAMHGFGDHALLRRELCDLGLMARTRDGRVYRRVERPMPAEAKALVRALKRRGGTGDRPDMPPPARRAAQAP